MDLRKIKKLIEMLEESNLSELEIREGEETVRLSRHPTGTAMPTYGAPPPMPVPAAPAPIPAAAVAASVAGSATAATAPEAGLGLPEGQVLRAPMVGTFYAAPSPGAPSYVSMGQQVKKGDTLATIEAMKMFNPIEAESDGVIKAILADNGQPVEFDQPLFVIG
jgi:acetyl-CoA carboxylase biotin carboxyl carrier protein